MRSYRASIGNVLKTKNFVKIDVKKAIMYNILEKNVLFFYRKVDEIDLVTGALSEAPVTGSVLGPTFICLLGRTFRNARIGMLNFLFIYTYKAFLWFCFSILI